MLVLTRKAGQNIHIGNEIVISIVRTNGGRVRLGIEAPPEVRILRDEVFVSDLRAQPEDAMAEALS